VDVFSASFILKNSLMDDSQKPETRAVKKLYSRWLRWLLPF